MVVTKKDTQNQEFVGRTPDQLILALSVLIEYVRMSTRWLTRISVLCTLQNASRANDHLKMYMLAGPR